MKNDIPSLIVTMLMIGLIVLLIYALIVYGNKPITEVPTWALWILRG